ncbi:MAG: ATP-dependent helicase [Pseudobutyrivibrio sp.]|nr:ATP-dependent helicase [Pseudobutyrivibrio sp.]
MELNSSQQRAVSKIAGPCLVLAGPGSGKTAVLTKRVFELIKSGIQPKEILVITFTKAAAIEMKERFDRLSDDVYPVTFGTFHSLFWGILQKELGYKSTDIVMGSARTKLLKEAMEMSNLNSGDGVLLTAYSSELSAFNCSTVFMESYEPKFVEKTDLIAFSHAYEYLKDKYKVIDFDDMLSRTYKLFIDKPAVLAKWQSRFSYFLVDEMQDMNDIQFQLIRMLSDRTRNLFCVGDDDQSIYGFRGANPRLMQSFKEVYPEAEEIVLDYNYRNPKNVVGISGKLIKNNSARFNKDIKSVNDDGIIDICEYTDDVLEAKSIIEKIKGLIAKGTDYSNIAILYRNHSDARFIVDALINGNIPFYLKEKMPNIYSHFIITDIEAYFQIAIGNSTKARLLSIINRPNRFIHRRSVEVGGDLNGMLRFYRDSPSGYRTVEALKADLNLISKMSPAAAINYIKNAMGYNMFLHEEAMKQGLNYNDYGQILDFLIQVLKDCKTIKQAIDKLNILRLKIDFENKSNAGNRVDKIGLYTLHSSKGLEFDNVFIIGVNEGVLPTNKADSKEDIEAERRLFYVGITRTKRNLYLSYTNKKNRDKSRFLVELDYSASNSSPKSSSKRAETAAYSSSD